MRFCDTGLIPPGVGSQDKWLKLVNEVVLQLLPAEAKKQKFVCLHPEALTIIKGLQRGIVLRTNWISTSNTWRELGDHAQGLA